MKGGHKVELGIRRVDEMLDGGVPSESAALLYGPPFIGKELLGRLFVLNGCRKGVPGIILTTGEAASDVRATLATIDPDVADYVKRGLLHFVDTYSKSIGADEEAPNCEYVDGPLNLSAVSLAVNNAQRKIIAEHAEHRLLIDSVSTLITYTNAQTTFRFLQVLVGKAERAGATVLLTMDEGMHTDAEVQTFKHLTDGVITVRTESGNHMLHVIGLGVTESRGWVEYRFNQTALEVTGSFGAGRIR